ncbi:MAG: DUF2612 domain-containing protein [Thiobacillus sp.]
MSSTVLDHQSIGRSRVATQYTESQKFLAYIRALLASSAELEAVLQKVAEQVDIDLAEGVNLDVIGEIVGISRIIPESVQLSFFGFEDNIAALNFGEEGAIGIGGRLYDEGEPYLATSVLNDPEYRLLIRAKIVKNHALGTNEDVIAGLAYLFGGGGASIQMVVEDIGGMAIQVAVGRQLTYLEKVLITNLDVLPRPAGVRISQRVTYNANGYFGFDGQLGALSFGEEGQPSVGGQFAEEF